MLVLLLMLAAGEPTASGAAGRPWDPSTDPYERLLACYVRVLEAKGLTMDSPKRDLLRYDKLARQRCATQIRAYRKVVGPSAFERDWKGIWEDYWSRL